MHSICEALGTIIVPNYRYNSEVHTNKFTYVFLILISDLVDITVHYAAHSHIPSSAYCIIGILT